MFIIKIYLRFFHLAFRELFHAALHWELFHTALHHMCRQDLHWGLLHTATASPAPPCAAPAAPGHHRLTENLRIPQLGADALGGSDPLQ